LTEVLKKSDFSKIGFLAELNQKMNPLTLHILILSLLSLPGFFFVFYCKHLYSDWQQVDSQRECKRKTELAFGLGICVGIIALCWGFLFYQTLTTSIFFHLTSPTYILKNGFFLFKSIVKFII